LRHFRNLIEFLGKPRNKLRPDDLSIYRPEDWKGPRSVNQGEVKKLVAEEVWERYEGRDASGNRRKDTISRYLQHCTKQRTESKDWPVRQMCDEISPSIERFRRILGYWNHVAVDDGEFVVGEAGASTATVRTFGRTGESK